MFNQKIVSVVIPTKNSDRYLKKVLESVRNQSYKNIEIIVVDNNSTDKTVEIVQDFSKRFNSLNVKLFNRGPERSSQKNFGAGITREEYILFLDSDAELSEKVVEECLKLGDKGYDMVIIPERHIGFGFWTKAKALERECFLNDDTIEAPWFFKKESFFSVGGYDENMFAGEDWDLFERMKKKGFRYARNQSFISHNLGYLNLWKMISKKYYYGKNLGIFAEKNKKSYLKKIPFFRKAYLKNWRLLVRNPILTLGLMFLKISETFFVALGIIKYKLSNLKKTK